MHKHETDYLIIGSGAVGMAFADIILTETDFNIVIVDKYQKPGGHWNMAYPFVTLHQPSNFYGVSSTELSKGRKDQVGLNKGLYDLASGAEVSAYFDDVMKHQFLPTDRVKYFPLCEYQGHGKFISLITGEVHEVKVNKKTVDATFLKTSVPSTHTPNFKIASDVQFIPINDLPKVAKAPAGFVIVGGGKTAIDACLWLLEHHVNPENITWIIPRDAWLLNRQNIQPGNEFFNNTIGSQATQFEAIVASESITDLFDRLEQAGILLRIDENVSPTMFHAATVSELELEQLRLIKNIVRKGRVKSIEKDKIILDQGEISTSSDHVHVDCSARALSNLEMKAVFNGELITPQTVRSYQPVFSAAFIAHIETAYQDEDIKNELCTVVPLPNHDTDWIRMLVVFMTNQHKWNQDKELRNWLLNNRLDGFSQIMAGVASDDVEKQAIIGRLSKSVMPAMMKLHQFMAEIPAS